MIDECIPVEESTDEFKEMIQEAHTYPQTHWDQVARILSKLQNGDCGDQVKGIVQVATCEELGSDKENIAQVAKAQAQRCSILRSKVPK